MRIIGYSERGAMNALFYGMAPDKEQGEESMKAFLKLAKIKGNFTDFELYNEFSLSDFGDPDLMIIAKNEDSEYVVFLSRRRPVAKIITFKSKKHSTRII